MKRSAYLLKNLAAALLLLVFNSARAQVTDIQKSYRAYQGRALQEKIYTHTDKDFYLTGEIIWLKVYNVDAADNTPAILNKLAYADVLDDNNNAVLQGKIALNNGTGSGSFYIPLTVKSGNYKLRVYTNWMKNFSPGLYFEKAITIVNPLTQPDVPAGAAPQTKGDDDLQFFPEGGNLVTGVTTSVGFKATDIDGKGVDATGVVVDEHNDTVARFRAYKFGMGNFLFTPQANHTYKAVIYTSHTNALTKNLPAISAVGYGLHLTNAGNDKLELRVSIRKGGNNNEQLYLFVHNNKQVAIAKEVVPDNEGNATISINKAQLGSGVNHLTLFNSAMQPVCERLYFSRPALLNLQAAVPGNYKPHSKISVNISSASADGKPQRANLSVAVYRLDSLTHRDATDIVSSLWLNSDVKGYVASPGYYFEHANPETDQALDNLMLTQGWSRFTWADVLNNPVQLNFQHEDEGHVITGLVTTLPGKPAPNVLTYLGVTGKKVQLYASASYVNGQLRFVTKDLYGLNEVVLQTNTGQDSLYHINIVSPFSEKYSTYKPAPLHLYQAVEKQLGENSIGMQVQNIYDAGKLKKYDNPVVDSNEFFGVQYKSYLLDNYTRFTTMDELLREYVSKIFVSKRKNLYHITMIDGKGNLNEKGGPLVLVDGVPFFNMNKIFAMDPLKIKELRIVNDERYIQPAMVEGVLSYTSYKGDFGGAELDPSAVVLDYEGMQLQREFYAPVYDTETQQKSHMPDFRNVLYWSPNVNTDGQGKASASFYTSDRTGKYIMVLQGLNDDGLVGSKYAFFAVVK